MKINKASLMLFGGLVGFVATNVMTAIGTKNYILKKEAMDHDPNLKEEAALMAVCYGPSVAVGSVSAGLIFGGNKSYAKAQAGLVSAYTLLGTRSNKLKEAVTKAIGVEEVKKIEQEINQPVIEEAKKQPVSQGSILVCDTYSGTIRFLETSMEVLQDAEYQMNRRLHIFGHVTLNDWYEYLGFEPTIEGETIGWNEEYLYSTSQAKIGEDDVPNSWLDFEHELVLEDNNQYYVLKFATEPIAGYMDY